MKELDWAARIKLPLLPYNFLPYFKTDFSIAILYASTKLSLLRDTLVSSHVRPGSFAPRQFLCEVRRC